MLARNGLANLMGVGILVLLPSSCAMPHQRYDIVFCGSNGKAEILIDSTSATGGLEDASGFAVQFCENSLRNCIKSPVRILIPMDTSESADYSFGEFDFTVTPVEGGAIKSVAFDRLRGDLYESTFARDGSLLTYEIDGSYGREFYEVCRGTFDQDLLDRLHKAIDVRD